MIESLELSNLSLGSRKDNITGHDVSKALFVKIQLFKLDRKRNSIREEYDILKRLNEKGCQTCPEVVSLESIAKDDLIKILDEDLSEYVSRLSAGSFDVMIQKYVQSDDIEYSLSDVLLSMIEQKMLGVYQGDIKKDNIRFDAARSLCVFVDYDQAITLSEPQVKLSIPDFLTFCDDFDKSQYGFGDWLRHFPRFEPQDCHDALFEDMLDLSSTTIMNKQVTTNSESGIYHSINGPYVYASGSRTLGERAYALDDVDFKQGEKVLDVGCNMGLLSSYLYERGCDVTGVDNDPRIVVLAKVVSNIIGKNIKYQHLDLDEADALDDFDTIFLFSVFHHTKKPIENARKIVGSCKRIIIETRLVENGKQPIDGVWTPTTRWAFESREKLNEFLEALFVGFKFVRNVAAVDKGRCIIEMVKDG